MRIGYHAHSGSIVIMGGGVFAPCTLAAVMQDDGNVRVRSLARKSELLCAWTEIATLDGARFATSSDAMAYLDGEFAKRRSAGDAYTIGIDIAERGQTVIPLQAPPSILSSVRLVVNGVEYRAPDIAASSVAVTWLNPAFALDPTDRATLIYS